VTDKKVYSNIGYLILVQFANYIAPLMVLPYLTRVLNVDGFGVVVMALSMCSIAMIITDFGFNLSGTYWISKHRNEEKLVCRYVGSVVSIKFVLSLIASIIALTYSSYANIKFGYTIQYAVVVIIFSQGAQLTWFFQGVEKMKNVTSSIIVSKLLYMLSIFLFVNGPDDVDTVLICLALSNVVSSVIGFFLLLRGGFSLSIPEWSEVKLAFKDSFPFFISRAAVGFYTSASTFIVGSAVGIHQAAIYSSAEKLYQAGQGVTAPVSQALYPYLARSGDVRSLYKFIIILLFPMIIGCSIFYVYAGDVLSLFYGPDFRAADSILKYFLVCSIINFVSVNFGYPAFATINRLDIVNRSVYLGGCIQIILLFVLFMNGNVNGVNVVRSVLFSEFVVMTFRITLFLLYRKKLSLRC